MSTPQKDFTVRYDKSEIAYMTQFLVSPSDEEVLLDLSSGLLDDGSQPATLPIQSRIALPWSATERLANILGQIVAQHKSRKADQGRPQQSQRATPTGSKSGTSSMVPQAKMPRATIPQVSLPEVIMPQKTH